MESSLCRSLLEDISTLTKVRVSIRILVTDDDSILRSHCRSLENGDRLLEGVPYPLLLADLSHRVKVMFKGIFALMSSTKKTGEMKDIDALRLQKYTSCYVMSH